MKELLGGGYQKSTEFSLSFSLIVSVFSVPPVFSVFDLPLSVFICVHLWFHSPICQAANSSISRSDRILATAPRILNARSLLCPAREYKCFAGLRSMKPSRWIF